MRVLFACLFVSLLMLAKAFQNACQNGRKIVQQWIKIDEKTVNIYQNGGLGVPGAILGGFGAPGRHCKVGTGRLDAKSRLEESTFGASMAENVDHRGDFGAQLGRQVGPECSFLVKNLQKIAKESIQGGFHKKRGKIMKK